MFIVQPLTPRSSIRSPLGFMSLATKWGNLLFPGITVLTTKFLQLALLLHECKEKKTKKWEWERIENHLKKRETHNRLEKKWRNFEEKEDVITKMTYWDRYGSMFHYFKLYDNLEKIAKGNNPRITSNKLHLVVFKKNYSLGDTSTKRNERIENTKVFGEINLKLENDKKNNFKNSFWWFCGQSNDYFNNRKNLKLSRQLEFALSLWQTYFEFCILTLSAPEKKIPTRPKKITQEKLYRELLAYSQGTRNVGEYDLARKILYVHKNYLKKVMPHWEEEVKKIKDTERLEELYTLYDGYTTVGDLSQTSPAKLFSKLVHLHQTYCRKQGKEYAQYVQMNARGHYTSKALLEKTSLLFDKTRFGIFGYRLNIANSLYQQE